MIRSSSCIMYVLRLYTSAFAPASTSDHLLTSNLSVAAGPIALRMLFRGGVPMCFCRLFIATGQLALGGHSTTSVQKVKKVKSLFLSLSLSLSIPGSFTR